MLIDQAFHSSIILLLILLGCSTPKSNAVKQDPSSQDDGDILLLQVGKVWEFNVEKSVIVADRKLNSTVTVLAICDQSKQEDEKELFRVVWYLDNNNTPVATYWITTKGDSIILERDESVEAQRGLLIPINASKFVEDVFAAIRKGKAFSAEIKTVGGHIDFTMTLSNHRIEEDLTSIIPQNTLVEEMTVSEFRKTKTIDADGKAVVVEGADNRLNITGNVVKLTVNGSKNKIIVDSAQSILMNGSSNTVKWKTRFADRVPNVKEDGSKNTVEPGDSID